MFSNTCKKSERLVLGARIMSRVISCDNVTDREEEQPC